MMSGPIANRAAPPAICILPRSGLSRKCFGKANLRTDRSNSGKAAHRCLPEEEGCRPANQHFNGYTQSKAEAEALLRSSGLPVLHLRPTIVLGAD